jgi:hypothetical protein
MRKKTPFSLSFLGADSWISMAYGCEVAAAVGSTSSGEQRLTISDELRWKVTCKRLLTEKYIASLWTTDTQNTHEYKSALSGLSSIVDTVRMIRLKSRCVVYLQKVMNATIAEPRTITRSVPDAEINVMIQILC